MRVGAQQGGGSRRGVRRRGGAKQRARGVLQVHAGGAAAQGTIAIIHVHLNLLGEVASGRGRVSILLIALCGIGGHQ